MLAVASGWGQGLVVSKRAKRCADSGSADNVIGGLSVWRGSAMYFGYKDSVQSRDTMSEGGGEMALQEIEGVFQYS